MLSGAIESERLACSSNFHTFDENQVRISWVNRTGNVFCQADIPDCIVLLSLIVVVQILNPQLYLILEIFMICLMGVIILVQPTVVVEFRARHPLA